MNIEVPGINIQWPWSELIATGQKKIETRSYPLPQRLANQWLAIIETPGPRGRSRGILKARVIGLVKFKSAKRYATEIDWNADQSKHLVEPNDPLFAFVQGKEKYGWIVEKALAIDPVDAPPKGIVYARPFNLLVHSDFDQILV